MDAIHNTAIGTLEHDWFVKIIHVIYTKIQKKPRNIEYKSRRLYIHKIIIACPQYAVWYSNAYLLKKGMWLKNKNSKTNNSKVFSK